MSGVRYTRCVICDNVGARSYRGQAPTCPECNSVISDTLQELENPWESKWYRDAPNFLSNREMRELEENEEDDDTDTGHRD